MNKSTHNTENEKLELIKNSINTMYLQLEENVNWLLEHEFIDAYSYVETDIAKSRLFTGLSQFESLVTFIDAIDKLDEIDSKYILMKGKK